MGPNASGMKLSQVARVWDECEQLLVAGPFFWTQVFGSVGL